MSKRAIHESLDPSRITYADAPTCKQSLQVANHSEIPNSSTVKIIPKDPRQRMKTKLERDFAAMLEEQRLCGGIDSWKYEFITFLLADDSGNEVRYTPDFCVLRGDTMKLVETKGFWHPAGLLKFRMARAQIPFELVAARKIKGNWVYTDKPSRDERKGERAKRKARGG